MAIRNIREIGEEILTKKCKEVTEMTDRIRYLIEDMLDTLYEANGVGLAAPQVGVLKRIVVIDVTGEDPYILINPRILETGGANRIRGMSECTGKSRDCHQAQLCESGVQDVDMKSFELEGTELLARAICHELDHLDGHLYVEKVEGELTDVAVAEDEV